MLVRMQATKNGNELASHAGSQVTSDDQGFFEDLQWLLHNDARCVCWWSLKPLVLVTKAMAGSRVLGQRTAILAHRESPQKDND